jgi:hypothetical protein
MQPRFRRGLAIGLLISAMLWILIILLVTL